MNNNVLAGLLLATALSLAGCGGGGGSGDGGALQAGPAPAGSQAPPDTTGVVAVALKDDPSENFLRIEITLNRVELLGNGDPKVVFDGDKTFDLLELQNFYDMLAVSDNVPVGQYDKIRLRVSRILLIRDDGHGGEEAIEAEIPANGKIDLNPRGPFRVAAGRALLIEIDIDANKSIHVVGTGNDRFRFRPVVFVEIRERQLLNGLVRVHGTVGDIADDDSSFELCDTDIRFDTHTDGCIVINVFGDETSVFDEDGDLITFAEVRGREPPVEATVYGIAVVVDDPDDADSDSDSDTDGDSDTDDLDSDSDSDSDDDDTVRMVQIDAIVVQLGPQSAAVRLDGIVLTEPENDLFEFDVDPGQGFTRDSVIQVLLQDGTRILSSDLTDLDASAIQQGVEASVAGVLQLSDTDPDLMKAMLIVIMDGDETSERLVGPIREVLDTTFTIAVDSMDRCVAPIDGARFFFGEESDDSLDVTEGDFDDLAPNQEATVFGMEGNDGCFHADVIFAIAPGDD